MINNIVTEVFNFNIYEHYLSTNRGTLVVCIAQTVYVLHHCKYIAICSIDVIIDGFDRFDLFFVFFVLRLTICQVLNFASLHRHETSYLYLLFHSRFSLIGTTDARVMCSFVFTRPFSNYRVRNFRLLLITRERLGLAT